MKRFKEFLFEEAEKKPPRMSLDPAKRILDLSTEFARFPTDATPEEITQQFAANIETLKDHPNPLIKGTYKEWMHIANDPSISPEQKEEILKRVSNFVVNQERSVLTSPIHPSLDQTIPKPRPFFKMDMLLSGSDEGGGLATPEINMSTKLAKWGNPTIPPEDFQEKMYERMGGSSKIMNPKGLKQAEASMGVRSMTKPPSVPTTKSAAVYSPIKWTNMTVKPVAAALTATDPMQTAGTMASQGAMEMGAAEIAGGLAMAPLAIGLFTSQAGDPNEGWMTMSPEARQKMENERKKANAQRVSDIISRPPERDSRRPWIGR